MNRKDKTAEANNTANLIILQENRLWETYFSDRSSENRNNIFNFYYEKCCTYVVAGFKKYKNIAHSGCSQQEILSDMSLRLLRAIEKYEPSINDTFLAYFLSPVAIRGIFIDAARRSARTHRHLDEDSASRIPDKALPNSEIEFLDMCDSAFEGTNDIDYEIALAIVFDGEKDGALMKQLSVTRARVKRIRKRLADAAR